MRILVTAGPTREPIDPVRFISNRSSGKMGYAVAAVSAKRGHEVVLVSGPVSLKPPPGVTVIRIETAGEMLKEVKKKIRWCDVLVMTAAVSDFRGRCFSREKIKKCNMPDVLSLEKTIDILMAMRPFKKGRTFVGFAAETSNIIPEAKKKLREKRLDLVVANDITRKDSGFGVDTNRVIFLSASGTIRKFPLMRKKQVAAKIIDWIEDQRGKT